MNIEKGETMINFIATIFCAIGLGVAITLHLPLWAMVLTVVLVGNAYYAVQYIIGDSNGNQNN